MERKTHERPDSVPKSGGGSFSVLLLHRLIFASVLFGIGMNAFIIPCEVVAGGFSGVALIFNLIFGSPVGLTVILLNLPFLAANAAVYGFGYIKRAFIGVFLTGGFTELFDRAKPMMPGRLSGALLGGAFVGVAMGMIFSLGYSTGGTDLAASLICRTRFGGRLSLGMLIFVCDALIIAGGYAAVRDSDGALLAVICVIVQSFFIDAVMKRRKKIL